MSLLGPSFQLITKDRVEKCHNMSPRRISFAYDQKNQPKIAETNKDFCGSFSVPFSETIKQVFESDTGLKLYPKNGVFWQSIRNHPDFTTISEWVQAQGTRHFLRDCLDLSIALDRNLIDNSSGTYTEIGDLERRAKEAADEDVLKSMSTHFVTAIRDLPYYNRSRYIAAVPPGPDKDYDLPSTLAKMLATELGLTDLTPNLKFKAQKKSLKALPLDQKWSELEASGLTFSGSLSGSPEVILSAVKTLRDSDNQ